MLFPTDTTQYACRVADATVRAAVADTTARAAVADATGRAAAANAAVRAAVADAMAGAAVANATERAAVAQHFRPPSASAFENKAGHEVGLAGTPPSQPRPAAWGWPSPPDKLCMHASRMRSHGK
eukprot:351570-Chlamydomonas_euryale.AAC.2